MKSYYIPRDTPMCSTPLDGWLRVVWFQDTVKSDPSLPRGEIHLVQDDKVVGKIVHVGEPEPKPDLAKEIFFREYCKPPRIERIGCYWIDGKSERARNDSLFASKINELIDAVNELREDKC